MKVMIVGAGKLGTKLAETMVAEHIDVTVIENNSEKIDRINSHMDVLTVHGSGVDISILQELNVEEYDLLVAVTSLDETNVVVCTLAKKLGCKMTVARIRNAEYLKQMKFIKRELGIDHVINPDFATAESIERYLLKSHSFYSDKFVSGKVQMIDINIETLDIFVGKKIKDLDNMKHLLIVAISRDGEVIIPNGETVLEEFDLIYIMGKAEEIDNISNKLDDNLMDRPVKNVMILGGSNIAYYLAKKLIHNNINVTIIEKNMEVCKKLAEKLNETLIIHGDGTDITLLEDEHLDRMDALVATTGFDESNLLMGIMAKQQGVRKVISKISRENYSKIIDRLDVDVAINPVYITSSKILKIIRGGKIMSVSLLIGGDGEVTEIILDDKLPILNKTLEELDLPKGIIIGSISRDGRVFIPDGRTRLMAKDRVVVFSLKENLDDLSMFFRGKKGGILGELWNSSGNAR